MTATRSIWSIGWYNGWSPDERRAVTPLQQAAVNSGAIARPTTCSICSVTPQRGSGNAVWFHNERYDRPLEVYAICRRCHWRLHQRFEEPEPWAALVAAHGGTGAWFELLTMDSASLEQPYSTTYPDQPPSRQEPADGRSPS